MIFDLVYKSNKDARLPVLEEYAIGYTRYFMNRIIQIYCGKGI